MLVHPKVPFYPLTPILGLISCFALVFYLKTNAIIAAGVWIALGMVAYEYNKKREVNPD